MVRYRRRNYEEVEHTPIFASDHRFIRTIRLIFFIFVIGLAFYLYILYEKGEATTFLIGAAEAIHTGINASLKKIWSIMLFLTDFFIQNPLIGVAVLLNNAFFIFIGYLIGIRRG